ncbi:hypothetical protein CAEBREN_19195 [Caenorhabditis brenneri]|uniref:Skp1-related protein n=1 Tax=Caenorhabditis brenneri TaxID=135651 RepID=G0MZK1_CAEBE|nr:hypothetical protein CAEBREN_19195 [Caenorhabditis brenneri]
MTSAMFPDQSSTFNMSEESSLVAAAPDTDAAPELLYKVQSSDGKEFKVSELAIQQSETLGRLIETMEYTAEDVETKPPIPLENISGDTLDLVFKWCEHHKGEPIPVDDGSVNVVISEFDKKLMDIDNMKLFHLMCAADYLSIKQLLNVSAKKVADMTKGKTPEELRKFLEIPTDEEDEAAQRAAVAEQEAAARRAAGEGPSGDAGEGSKNAST